MYAHYRENQLYIEDVSVEAIAGTYDTPCYVYSRAAIEDAYRRFAAAWTDIDHSICYSVKSNSNLAVLNILAQLGSGFDIVSGGELERVLRAGGDPQKTVFSGVGKTPSEIHRALDVEIFCFNVESRSELELIKKISAARNLIAPVSIRVNPDVDPNTHPHIATGLRDNKFGVDMEEAIALYEDATGCKHINLLGIDCHIGSQITEISPFTLALEKILDLARRLEKKGIEIRHLDLGGGLGVKYKDETAVDIEEYAAAIRQMLGSGKYHLAFEPGRYITANAGWLIARVLYLKENQGKHFAVVDAAMNDLLRPALYDAWQEVLPATVRPGNAGSDAGNSTGNGARNYDIVGPVCESADYLAKDRKLSLLENDLLVVASAGAYGFVMSSNYNSRNRPPEILVDGDQSFCVRKRETIDDQLKLEQLIS